jgi:hypothetical protein
VTRYEAAPRTPAPFDVVVAALAQPLTDTTVEARAGLIVAALTRYGHLPAPEVRPTLGSVHRAAQWLAEASGHPRYTQSDDGWRKLLQSEGDVDCAATAAYRYAGADESYRDQIRGVRAVLLQASRHPVV